ncbi:MAG: hypothetical protein KDC45_16135, partial [Bacteroidetes bacterium]|nr:hypothetical protein [Bacteroidota bacterium]
MNSMMSIPVLLWCLAGSAVAQSFEEQDSSSARQAYRSTVVRAEKFIDWPVRSINSLLNDFVPSAYLYKERWPDPWRYFSGAQNTSVPSPYQKRLIEGVISRGQQPADLGFYFGGMLLNDPFSGHADLALPYQAIESVEMENYGQPSSVAGYSGGVVRIRPIEPGEKLTGSAEVISDFAAPALGAYSYGRRIVSARVAGPVLKGVGLVVVGQWQATDDADPGFLGHPDVAIERDRGAGRLDTAIFGRLKKGSRPDKINASGEASLYGALHLQLVRNLKIKVEELFISGHRNVFTPEYILAPSRVPHIDRDVSHTTAAVSYHLLPNMQIEVRAGYSTSKNVLTERS